MLPHTSTVTVTVCAVFQFVVVKVSEAGEKVTFVLLLDGDTVTPRLRPAAEGVACTWAAGPSPGVEPFTARTSTCGVARSPSR